MTDPARTTKLTRQELMRVNDEFQSERDAAKGDAMRAFDERNIALNAADALRAQVAALQAENAKSQRAFEEQGHLYAKLETERAALQAQLVAPLPDEQAIREYLAHVLPTDAIIDVYGLLDNYGNKCASQARELAALQAENEQFFRDTNTQMLVQQSTIRDLESTIKSLESELAAAQAKLAVCTCQKA